MAKSTHYVIKFVSDLWQFGGFSPATPVSSMNKTDLHVIARCLAQLIFNYFSDVFGLHVSSLSSKGHL
jgi:hypothetical protein